MLNQYLAQTQELLQYPVSNPPLYSSALLTGFINTARGQLAGMAECIRFMGTLTTAPSVRVYPFSAISLSGSTGIQGILNVRSLWYLVGVGQKFVSSRPFEWFSLYELGKVVPPVGPPAIWAQFGQGANGTIYVSPLPDIAYTQPADCVCFPIPLVDDTTIEAIPYLWTDAVPYYAAYLALMSSQTGARLAQAKEMLNMFNEFVGRARAAATPSIMPTNFAQVPNPMRPNQLGMSSQKGASG